MLLIVILHMSGSCLDDDVVRQSCDISMGWMLGYRSFTFLGVTTFAFISGFYGVKFHVGKFLSMEFMALFYGIIVLLALYLRSMEIHLNDVRNLLFPITSNHLWYFSGYMILMCVSPLLNEGVKELSKESFKGALGMLMLIIYGARFVSGGVNADFFNLLLVYLLGRYLKNYPCMFLISYRYRIFWSCVSLNFILSFFFGCNGLYKINLLFEGNNNPITALGAISLFYIFLNMNKTLWINTIISKFAPNMLAVYVLHELARTEGLIDFASIHGKFIVIMPLASGIVLVIALCDKVRSLLFRPFVNKLNKIKI